MNRIKHWNTGLLLVSLLIFVSSLLLENVSFNNLAVKSRVKQFEEEYYAFMEKEFPDVGHDIKSKKDIDDSTTEKLKQAAEKFRSEFKAKL